MVTTSRALASFCGREDIMSLNFTVTNLKFNPLTSFEGNCNIQSDISAAGVSNTNLPWSIEAHSVVQLYRSVSLSVFLIMYRQRPEEWPDFTVCQRLNSQCGPKTQLASEHLYKTLVTTDLGAVPSHMTHRVRPPKLLKNDHQFNYNITSRTCLYITTLAIALAGC